MEFLRNVLHKRLYQNVKVCTGSKYSTWYIAIMNMLYNISNDFRRK